MGAARREVAPIRLRPDRVLFPATGFTKHDAVDYYLRIAPVLLPHVRNRPMSFRRFPATVRDESFWEKDAPGFTPERVKRIEVERRGGKSAIEYVVIGDRTTLAWVADAGGLELHPFLHGRDLDRPTAVAFDLDPGDGATLADCAAVSVILREVLESLGLESWAKVSGGKGIHVYVPLNTPATHEQTTLFARLVAEDLARRHPDRVIARMAKRQRRGRVFVDHSQNADYKTMVAVYSLRAAGEGPLVSMPVTWDEIERAARTAAAAKLRFDPRAALRRVEAKGDLFGSVLRRKQKLPDLSAGAATRTTKKDADDSPEAGAMVRGIRLPRPGSQSGRRLYLLTKSKTGNELWLDRDGMLQRFILRADREGSEALIAMPAGEFRTHPAYYRGEVQPEYRGEVTIEDAGSYEIIEGSWREKRLDAWFTGRVLEGEWILAKTSGPKHRSWRLERHAASPWVR